MITVNSVTTPPTAVKAGLLCDKSRKARNEMEKIATLMPVLQISTVISTARGASISRMTRRCSRFLDWRNSEIVWRDNENNAVSEAETHPEHTTNAARRTQIISVPFDAANAAIHNRCRLLSWTSVACVYSIQ
jgi:hypothetical protein